MKSKRGTPPPPPPSPPYDWPDATPPPLLLPMRTPSPLLLLLLLVLLLRRHSAPALAASTVAISHGSSTICAIAANASRDGIHCWGEFRGKFSLDLGRSLNSIAATRDFVCGLTADATQLFCWDLNANVSGRPKRVYKGLPLSNLTAGEWHVAAMRVDGRVLFWRGRNPQLPSAGVPGKFATLASGKNFTCAIEASSRNVSCWGDAAGLAPSEAMQSIAAGNKRVCGVTATGALICTGAAWAARGFLRESPFEFHGAAVGDAHLCALRRENSTVKCWSDTSGGGGYAPVNGSFLFLVAGGELTCGLLAINYTVVCWHVNGTLVRSDLPKALPGACELRSSCKCFILDSSGYCGGSRVVCNDCNPPLPPPPPPLPPPPPPPTGNCDGDGLRNKLLLAFGVVGSFAGACAAVYCVLVAVRKKKVHNSVLPSVGTGPQAPPPAPPTSFTSSLRSFRSRSASAVFGRGMRRQRSGTSGDRAEEFSLRELTLATGFFSPTARIGSGSFGSVYRGKLADGREVAIKRKEPGLRPAAISDRDSEFHSELAFLSRLHHRNLVTLHGSCEDGDEQLLVYEYMSNGSLYEHLHTSRSAASPLHSSWRLRMKLLLDAARGVEYLHHYAVPPIIHRDIKPSNILIDAAWTARISDFGLSLVGAEHDGGRKAGTLGYMDPEYYGLHHLTAKSDVYGFGVVMLEVLTGKKAIFRGESGLMNVVDYAWGSVAEGDVRRVLDGRVVGPYEGREAEALELAAYTAGRCVSLVGSERPSMRDVVANLEAALALCEEAGNGGAVAGSMCLTEVSLD